MADLATIMGMATAGIGALKGAADTAQVVRELVTRDDEIDPELKAQLSDLLDQVIAAKSMNVQIIEAMEQMRDELKRYQDFDTELERYRMIETQSGAIVWQLKPDRTGDQPNHFLCTKCAEEKRKSILQGHSCWRECPTCKTSYEFDLREYG